MGHKAPTLTFRKEGDRTSITNIIRHHEDYVNTGQIASEIYAKIDKLRNLHQPSFQSSSSWVAFAGDQKWTEIAGMITTETLVGKCGHLTSGI